MTGFGKAETVIPAGKITVEIRSLNAKNADISIKTSLIPKDKEIEVRQKLAQRLKRGTIDFYISFDPNIAQTAKAINGELVGEYFAQASAIRRSLGINDCESGNAQSRMDNELLATILRFPDIIDAKKQDIINDGNWPVVDDAIDRALDALELYRETEGKALYKDVTGRVAIILALENEVEGFEKERMDAVKAKILKNLEDLKQQPDPSRFEQELVFYLEKLDINEEKVRLRQHCKYFLDTIDQESEPGKKLGFIIQEMGREINTTGSKANHAGMQKAVVRMKDELEKIREQSMNIL